MVIILDNYSVEQRGWVTLDVNVAFEVKVTAAEAQTTVRRWLQDNVSLYLNAALPTLVLLESQGDFQAVWRVPVDLRLPSQPIMPITQVDVDVSSGVIVSQEQALKQIFASLESEVHPRLQLQAAPLSPIVDEYLNSLRPPPHFAN